MPQTYSKDKPYFLTKQTANLQEDFRRDIKNGASLFLLYGEEGVGKTRLLRELASSRLSELKIHWVDCKMGVDESNASSDLGPVLDSTLDIATTGDVIVADHFEFATNKIKHQLLQSWSTDGIDKNFSLIISTDQSRLDEIRELATRYQLNVKSFQLLPLTNVEIDDYCTSTLFPSLPASPLSISKQSQRALKETRGVIGKLRDVVELNSNDILMQAPSNSPTILKPLLVVVGLTFVLVLAGAVYHFMPLASVEPLSANNQEEVIELSLPIDNAAVSIPAVEVAETQNLPIPEPKAVARVPVKAELVITEPVAELTPIGEASVEKTDIPQIINSLDFPRKSLEPQDVEVGTTLNSEPVKTELLVDIVGKAGYSDWFKDELKRSRDWLENSERSRSAIQIMSISFDSETDDAYFSYVKRLQKKGVDISQLRVYPTRVQEKIVFGIIFGDYDSRRIARQSVSDLPLSLGANQPISRSAGGIWNEISQL